MYVHALLISFVRWIMLGLEVPNFSKKSLSLS